MERIAFPGEDTVAIPFFVTGKPRGAVVRLQSSDVEERKQREPKVHISGQESPYSCRLVRLLRSPISAHRDA